MLWLHYDFGVHMNRSEWPHCWVPGVCDSTCRLQPGNDLFVILTSCDCFHYRVNVCISKLFHIANTLESSHTTGGRMSSLLAAVRRRYDPGLRAVTSEEYFLSFLCQSHNFTRDLIRKWWGLLSLPTLQYPEYSSGGFHSSIVRRSAEIFLCFDVMFVW